MKIEQNESDRLYHLWKFNVDVTALLFIATL